MHLIEGTRIAGHFRERKLVSGGKLESRGENSRDH